MALTKPLSPDRSKTDMHDEKQVKAWCKRLGISSTELAQIVQSVGSGVAAIQKELERAKHPKSRPKT